jgi:hypothetical protein
MLAEWAHQARSTMRSRWTGVLPIMMMIAASAAALMLDNVEQWARQFGVSAYDLHPALQSVVSTLTMLIIIVFAGQHLGWVNRAVRGAGLSLAREKQGRTWESLLLTNIDARQIVLGKWWGTLRAVWAGQGRLLALRLVMTLWLASPLSGGRAALGVPLDALSLLLACIVAVSYPPFFTGFGAAVGVLASLFARQEAVAVRVASGAQVVATLGGMIAVGVGGIVLFAGQSLLLSIGAPIDGGATAILGLLLTSGLYGVTMTTQFLAIGLTLAVFSALTTTALLLAQWVAVRQQAGKAARRPPHS